MMGANYDSIPLNAKRVKKYHTLIVKPSSITMVILVLLVKKLG